MEINTLIETLKEKPETYTTLIGKNNQQTTERKKLERKLKWPIKHGDIMIGKIIKTGHTIFYGSKKQYNIFMIEKNNKIITLFAKEYKIRRTKIIFADCHILNCTCWQPRVRKIYDLKDVKKWI